MIVNDLSAGRLEQSVMAGAKIVDADGSVRDGKSPVVAEHNLELYINEALTAKLVCTPSHLPEMVVGRMITESYIKSADDIESIYICEYGRKAKVFLKDNIALTREITEEPTCCTGNQVFLVNNNAEKLKPLEKAAWTSEQIFALANEFANGSLIHKATKGAHCCYLSYNGVPVFAVEDIGRHNALDKAIGHMVMNGYDRNKCIAFTTGRVPTDMVKKAVAARIPVLVSKAVPTDQTLDMAKYFNLTLICKAWPDRFEIFNEAI